MTDILKQISDVGSLLVRNDVRKFAASQLVEIFDRVADNHRSDKVIMAMGNIFHSKAEQNPSQVISSEQINAWFNDLAGLDPNSQFRTVFSNVLPVVKTAAKKVNPMEARRDYFTSDTSRDLEAVAKKKYADIEVDEHEEIADPASLSKEVKVDVAEVEQQLTILGSQHSRNTVQSAIESVAHNLEEIGYKSQVRFKSDNEAGVILAAALETEQGRIDVDIPVEITSGQCLFPESICYGDKTYKFNKSDLQSLLNKNAQYIEAPRYPAELIDMGYNDLRKVVHRSVLDRKHVIAHEALNLINDKFDSDMFKRAFQDYEMWLKESTDDSGKKCLGCNYLQPSDKKGAVHTADWCGLASCSVSKMVKTASGICVKSTIRFDKSADEYKGELVTSRVQLT